MINLDAEVFASASLIYEIVAIDKDNINKDIALS